MAQCTEWARPRAKPVRRNAHPGVWTAPAGRGGTSIKKARLQEVAGQEEPAQNRGRNQGFLQPVVRLPITLTV